MGLSDDVMTPKAPPTAGHIADEPALTEGE